MDSPTVFSFPTFWGMEWPVHYLNFIYIFLISQHYSYLISYIRIYNPGVKINSQLVIAFSWRLVLNLDRR